MIIEIILLIITIAIFLLIHDIVKMAKIIKKLQLQDKEIMDTVNFIGENIKQSQKIIISFGLKKNFYHLNNLSMINFLQEKKKTKKKPLPKKRLFI